MKIRKKIFIIISLIFIILCTNITNTFADIEGRLPERPLPSPGTRPELQDESDSSSPEYNLDEVIDKANDFINEGKSNGGRLNQDALKAGSNTIYNILLALGMVVAVAVGMGLAIKFMLSNAEDKAKVKESLIPYIAGCVVIFGAFTIWKIVIVLLGEIG